MRDPYLNVQEAKDQLKDDLIKYFDKSDCPVRLASLYVLWSPAQKQQNVPDPVPELVLGQETIQETLLGQKFNISPLAFFQVRQGDCQKSSSPSGL